MENPVAGTTGAQTTDPRLPLAGVRVLDLGGIGPGPFATMLLADLGAEVIRLSRSANDALAINPVLDRGKKSAIFNLKHPEAAPTLMKAAASVDVVIEGFRPGVAERLGLGPSDFQAANPALVYGRMTGFGQDGPLSQSAGHDMNYIATSGVLAQLGRADGGADGTQDTGPVFPANLAGDFGGGGMFLVVGVLSGVVRARATGEGSVVDASMVEGSNALWAMMHGFTASGQWHEGRGTNMLDSGAPYYDRYLSKDGKWFSVGCIEPQFFAAFVEKTGVADRLPGPVGSFNHADPKYWDALRPVFTEAIASRTGEELEALFDGVDACVFPILGWERAQAAPHNVARGVFYRDEAGNAFPGVAPRFRAAGSDSGPAAGGADGQAGGGASDADASVAGTATDWSYVRPEPAAKIGSDNRLIAQLAGLDETEFSRLNQDGLFG